MLDSMGCEVAEAGGFGFIVDSSNATLFTWFFVVICKGEERQVLVLLWLGDWRVVVVGASGTCCGGGGGFREGFVVEERERRGFGDMVGGGGGS
ncbi:hypothetical protein AHAS_Ahas13G0317200 [Arachis hypogaea]